MYDNEPTQEEVDCVVARIRRVVSERGRSSDELATLRTVYELFHKRPDKCSWGMLLGVLDKLDPGL